MARIKAFQIYDCGVDHEQYFPGRGVAGSEWTGVVVGVGDSANEAGDDALEYLAQAEDVDGVPPVLENEAKELSAKMDAHSECMHSEDKEEACPMHHYVAIYWR
jgi:hypothetical protein